MNKHFLFYDIYERHKKVGSMIKNGETVLDVGGELNHLTQFSNPKKIIVANLNTGDVIIKKGKLPFQKKSFDTVCSIDVLEHIPKKDRKNFIDDLVLLASKKVILSFPIGTENHNKYEKKAQIFLKDKGLSVKYLEEHIKYGLPTNDEINNLIKGLNFKIYYSGNIKINWILFNLFIFDPKTKFVRKAIYILKLLFNFIFNPFLYILLSNKQFGPNINRAYLIIYRHNV